MKTACDLRALRFCRMYFEEMHISLTAIILTASFSHFTCKYNIASQVMAIIELAIVYNAVSEHLQYIQ